MIYEYCKINEDAGATYELQDLFAVQLKGDKLEGFLQTWDATLTGMKAEPDPNVMETLFLQQVRKAHSMKDDIVYYDRLDRGHADRTYDNLLRAAHKVVERKRHEANRADIERQLRGDGAPAAPAKGKGKGKGKKNKDKRGRSESRSKQGICYDLKNKGKCERGSECTFSHDLSRSGSRGSSNGSNGAKKGGKSRGNTPDPKKPCEFFKAGKCTFGDKCRNYHDPKLKPGAPAEKEKAKAEPKAKAKKEKAKATGPAVPIFRAMIAAAAMQAAVNPANGMMQANNQYEPPTPWWPEGLIMPCCPARPVAVARGSPKAGVRFGDTDVSSFTAQGKLFPVRRSKKSSEYCHDAWRKSLNPMKYVSLAMSRAAALAKELGMPLTCCCTRALARRRRPE